MVVQFASQHVHKDLKKEEIFTCEIVSFKLRFSFYQQSIALRKKFPLSNFIWIGKIDKILSINLSGLIDAIIEISFLIEHLNQPLFCFFFSGSFLLFFEAYQRIDAQVWKFNKSCNHFKAQHCIIATWTVRHTKLNAALECRLVKPARSKLHELFELELFSSAKLVQRSSHYRTSTTCVAFFFLVTCSCQIIANIILRLSLFF